jgi:hypothetical protein
VVKKSSWKTMTIYDTRSIVNLSHQRISSLDFGNRGMAFNTDMFTDEGFSPSAIDCPFT